MWVKCDFAECEHCRDGECQLHSISITDGECDDYTDYMRNNPLYSSTYFKRIRMSQNGRLFECRVHAKGRRYEYKEFVFYTGDDIRFSIDNASFTEERTGILISGDVMQSDKFEHIILNAIAKTSPVMELPWMEYDFKAKKYVPHVENAAEKQEINAR